MNISKNLKRLVTIHVRAQISLSWIGAEDPADHHSIIEAAHKAKKELYNALDELAKSTDKGEHDAVR